MTSRKKNFWIVLMLLVLVGGAVAFYMFSPPSAASKNAGGPPAGPPGGFAIPVEAALVRSDTVNVTVSAVGSVLANESVMIRPEIAGRITAIHFSEGEAVKKGDPLVTIDATELRAQRAESAAAVKLNQLSFNRAAELVQKKLVSQQDYDQAQANLSAAQAKQALNQAQLDKTDIRVPFDGIVGLRRVSPGDYVQPAQDIVNLEDIASVKLDFSIPETYLAQVQEQQTVEVHVDSFPDSVFTGTIYAIAPRIDENTRTVQIRARIPNLDKKLRPGMFARVNLVLQSRPNALLVPEQALVPQGNDRFVYRVVEGKAVMTKVTIGQRTETGEVEIREGLNTGDMIVTAGQQKIHGDAQVQVISNAENKTPEAAH